MTRAAVAACALLALVSCDGWRNPTGPEVLGPERWEVVYAAPGQRVYSMASSPDGAIFLAMFDGAVWRGRPRQRWERIAAPGELLRMYAPSGSTLFAASGPHIYQWDEGRGLREEPTPVDTATVRCYDSFTSERIEALWERHARDVYAVGEHGLIVHFDGTAWRMEANPLRAAAPSVCYQAYPTDLFAVGGNDTTVFAAGGSVAVRGAGGVWRTLIQRQGEGTGWFIRGVATRPDGVLLVGSAFGRGPRGYYESAHIAMRRGQTMTVDTGFARRVRPLDYGGVTPDGRAVFWSFSGDVMVADGWRTRGYRLTGVKQLRGAVPVGADVYVSFYRERGDTAYIARLRQ